MLKIIDHVGCGKTRRLVEAAKDCGGSIICANPDKLFNKAVRYGIAVPIYSYEDFLQGKVSGKIFIHNAEEFLNFIVTSKISTTLDGYTLCLD